MVGFAMVARLGDNLALAHHDGPYGHLSRFRRATRLNKGRLHIQPVERVGVRDALRAVKKGVVRVFIARVGFLYAFFLHASCLSYIFSFL